MQLKSYLFLGVLFFHSITVYADGDCSTVIENVSNSSITVGCIKEKAKVPDVRDNEKLFFLGLYGKKVFNQDKVYSHLSINEIVDEAISIAKLTSSIANYILGIKSIGTHSVDTAFLEGNPKKFLAELSNFIKKNSLNEANKLKAKALITELSAKLGNEPFPKYEKVGDNKMLGTKLAGILASIALVATMNESGDEPPVSP